VLGYRALVVKCWLVVGSVAPGRGKPVRQAGEQPWLALPCSFLRSPSWCSSAAGEPPPPPLFRPQALTPCPPIGPCFAAALGGIGMLDSSAALSLWPFLPEGPCRRIPAFALPLALPRGLPLPALGPPLPCPRGLPLPAPGVSPSLPWVSACLVPRGLLSHTRPQVTAAPPITDAPLSKSQLPPPSYRWGSPNSQMLFKSDGLHHMPKSQMGPPSHRCPPPKSQMGPPSQRCLSQVTDGPSKSQMPPPKSQMGLSK